MSSFDPRTQLPLLPSARKLKAVVVNNINVVAKHNDNTDRSASIGNDSEISSQTTTRPTSDNNDEETNNNYEKDDGHHPKTTPNNTTPPPPSTTTHGTKIQNLWSEQLAQLSIHPPLPTSDTTAMTLRFISTTVTSLNSFAVMADEKLERCGKRIRDLDVKMALLE